MHRWGRMLLLGCFVLMGAGALFPHTTGHAAQDAARKKHCHYVTKKVHGKKKRVKVCKTTKPTPKPTKKPTKKPKKKPTKKPTKTPTPRPTSTATPTLTPTDYGVLASQLAAGIDSATAGDVRYRAVVAALDALDIPVLKADGSFDGQAKTPGVFFLPSGEVRAISAAFDSKSMVGFDVPAAVLGAAQVKVAGGTPSASTLHDAITSAIGRATASPTDSHSLADLLLLQLGLHASPSSDLRTAAAGDAVLDPLQLTIVLVEGLMPITNHSAARAVAHLAHAETDPCTDPGQSISTRWWDQDISTASDASGSSTTLINLTTVVGAATVWEYQLEADGSMPDGTSTHYGPKGEGAPDAGKDLRFMVNVRDSAVDTAPCAAPFVAPTGGAGVGISWDAQEIAPHGTVDPAPPVTDDTGDNTLTFHPKDEAVPGLGPEVTRDVTVTAKLNFQTTVPDPILQAELNSIFSTQPVAFHASISYHDPAGFKFSGITVHYWTDLGSVRSDTYVAYSGHVCGNDPYATPWQFHADKKITEPSGTYTDSNDFEWNFKTDTVNPGSGDFFEILPGPPPQMQVTWGAIAPVHPAKAIQTAPIEEDTSCPAGP